MLKVVADESAIRRYQRQFVKSLKTAAAETIPVKLGHPGASEKAKIAWSESLGHLVLLQEARRQPLLERFRHRPPGRRRQCRDHLRDQFSPLRNRPADRRRLCPGPHRAGSLSSTGESSAAGERGSGNPSSKTSTGGSGKYG